MPAAAGPPSPRARRPCPLPTSTTSTRPARPPPPPATPSIRPGDPLPEANGTVDLSPIADADGWVTIAGFGSLLSRRSATFTFPELRSFRTGRLTGAWRRVFAHTTAIFHTRGIARPTTREVASLSVEPVVETGRQGPTKNVPPPPPLVVSLFEVPATADAAAALVEREHEFQLLAVPVVDEGGESSARLAVVCAAWDDAAYRATRCPPDEWARRYTGTRPDGQPFHIPAVWDDPAVLPCRAYLRHCVLAARSLGPAAEACLLDNTFLADRSTPLRAYLAARPDILSEEPPPELRERYSG